jgi:hypothetical protein
MKYNIIVIILSLIVFISCVSTKSTLKNVDETSPIPTLSKTNTFVIKEFSKDKKYGYDKDYPINVFYLNATNETINQQRFLNALTGPKGEKINYTKKGVCCPFPTKNNSSGSGLLDEYEITWDGLATPVLLYFNIYEKGLLMVPFGFGLKK